MNQIIVKRPANISSQEALTELVLEYPESEVLSFRRVKSAGMDGEYFVATLRVAEHDEHVGDEEHDRDEDAKLDKIIRLIEQLIEKDKAVHKEVEQKPLIEERPPVKNPVPLQPMAKCDCWDGYCRVPGTKPCEEGSCEKCDAARKKSMVVVERNADVSKTKAKLELLKEFGKEYKIARLAKTGSIYSATLVKRAAEGEIPIMSMRPARNPLTLEHRHRKQMPIKDPNDCDCCDADDPDCDCRDCHDDKTASLKRANEWQEGTCENCDKKTMVKSFYYDPDWPFCSKECAKEGKLRAHGVPIEDDMDPLEGNPRYALVKRADLREEQEAEMYEIWDNQAELDRKKDDKSECDCCEDDGMCECDCHDGGERYMNDRWD